MADRLTVDATSALQELIRNLDKRFKSSLPDSAESRSLRHKLAQMDIGNFLCAIECGDIGQHFYSLANAMDDSNHGIFVPFLSAKTSAKGGRPPDPWDIWSARSWVAIAVECYRRADRPDNVIAQRIFKHEILRRLLRPGQKINLKAAPFSWLDQLKDGRVRSPLAKSRWQLFSDKIADKKYPDDVWNSMGDEMLAKACSCAEQLTP